MNGEGSPGYRTPYEGGVPYGSPPSPGALAGPSWSAYSQPPVDYVPRTVGPPPWALGNIGARLGARLLDLVGWWLVYGIVAGPIVRFQESLIPLILVWLVATWVLWFPFSLSRFGCTLGKRVCGVRAVQRESAQRLRFWQAVGREAFWLVSLIVPILSFLNSLWCCWDRPFQQCLHDKVADTVVVSAKRSGI